MSERRPLPEYLLQTPDLSRLDPPTETLVATLPLSDLTWQHFEQLCVALAQELNPEAEVGLYGEQGDEQEGIDFYIETADEMQAAQCRRVKAMGPAAIECAVNDFLDGDWASEVSTFVLATTQSLRNKARNDEYRRQSERLRAKGVTFMRWDSDVLCDLLRSRRDVVRRFFGDRWEARFCGPPIVDAPVAVHHLRPVRPTFAGRRAELDQLRSALPSDRAATVVLHGLSGSGKTELAACIADSLASRYEVAVWIEANDQSNLVAELAGLAPALGVGTTDHVEADAAAVREHLGGRRNWLVVVDGLAEPDTALNWLPVGRGGHTLITSQHYGGWRMLGATPIPVGALQTADAVKLVLQLSGSSDESSAAAIVERLGGLALAIVQAGVFADVSQTSLSALCEILDEDPEKLLSSDLAGVPKPVSRLWEIAFAAVERDKSAALLLHGFAWFDQLSVPAEIQETVLRCADPSLDLSEARVRLLQYSLIDPGPDGDAMHRLVSEALRVRGGSISTHALEVVLAALNEVLGRSFARVRPFEVEALILHANVAVQHALARGRRTETVGRVALMVGSSLVELGRPDEGRDLLRESIAVLRKTAASSRLQSSALNDYGIALRDAGDLDEAEEILNEALELKRHIYAPRKLVGTLINIGTVQQRRGQLGAAEKTVEVALKLVDGDPPVDPLATAQLLTNQSIIRLDQRDPKGARDCLRRALGLLRALDPQPQTEIAYAMAGLANAELDLGNVDAAIAHNRTALHAKIKLAGPSHPTVADTLANLANALAEDGQLGEAEATLRRALEMRADQASSDHLAIAQNQAALGTILVRGGRVDAGIALQRAALSTIEDRLDEDHPLLVLVRENLEISESRMAGHGDT